MTEVSVGQAIREVRLARGLRQGDVAGQVYVSREMFAKVEQGKRRIAADVQPRVARQLDDPRVCMELAAEATGGIGPVYLDGERVDLHRASVKDKAVEELAEAIEALSRARKLTNARGPDDLDDDGRKQLADVLHELVEAQTAIGMTIAVLCRTYKVSLKGLYDAHRAELAAKGYIARKNKRPAQSRPAND